MSESTDNLRATPHSRNFPRMISIISLVVTTSLMALLGRFSWESYRHWQTTAMKAVRLQELIGIIQTSDEILTMSARMASVTGDPRWEERYLQTEPHLDEALDEALVLLPESELSDALSQTHEANIALVAMERYAFDLLRVNRRDRAEELLFSDEYQRQKTIYSDGTRRALTYMEASIQATLRREQQRALASLIGAIAAILISLTIWLILLRISNLYLSQRDRTEEELRRSRSLLDSIFENLPVMVVMKEANSLRYTRVNRAVEDVLGYTRDDLLGREDFSLPGRSRKEAENTNRSDRRALEEGILVDIPEETLRTRSRESRILHTKKIPLYNGGEKPEYLLTISEDITEKIQNERRLKQQEEGRNRSRRIESVGTLAGGIAHDFNNLLHGVFGYISLAKEETDNPEKCAEMLGEAEEAMHMAVSLTSRLLTFSKGGKPLTKILSLVPITERAIQLSLSGSRITHTMSADSDLWDVIADGDQIGQVIQNILLNADQAMPGGGSVQISLRNRDRSAGDLPPELRGEAYVELAVSDRGTGIGKEDLERIFEPYFTTKEMGNGLGLATSYSILKNHGGIILVSSEPGEGSTFRVFLPASPPVPSD